MTETNSPVDHAVIVGSGLSPEARRLANDDGWEDHARMHRKTAAEYEARVCLVYDDPHMNALHDLAHDVVRVIPPEARQS